MKNIPYILGIAFCLLLLLSLYAQMVGPHPGPAQVAVVKKIEQSSVVTLAESESKSLKQYIQLIVGRIKPLALTCLVSILLTALVSIYGLIRENRLKKNASGKNAI
ncbi:MAG: hypothetical protein AB2689_16180 [Candidatus Thiodiazotropha taylori]